MTLVLPTCADRLGLGPPPTRSFRRFRPISVLFVAHFSLKRSECSLDVSLYLHPLSKSLVLQQLTHNKPALLQFHRRTTAGQSPIVCVVCFLLLLSLDFSPMSSHRSLNVRAAICSLLLDSTPNSLAMTAPLFPTRWGRVQISISSEQRGYLRPVSMQLARCPFGG